VDCSLEEFTEGKPAKLKRRIFEADAAEDKREWRHGSNSTFVKVECRGGEVKCKPRLISSVEPMWVANVGPWLHSIDVWIHENKCFGHAKFLTPWEVADWFCDRGYDVNHPLFHFYDFSGFDLHCSTLHFQFERLFLLSFGVPEAVVDEIYRSEIAWSGYRHTEEGFGSFSVRGRCRQSGDPQTSCCNNAIAIMLHLFAVVETYQRVRNLPGDWYKTSHLVQDLKFVELLNNGDDCVMYNPIIVPDLAIYGELGMQLEVKHGEFCQTAPLITSSLCIMVRHPREFLSRYGFTTTQYPPGDVLKRRQHLHMISVANSSFCTRVPIYWAVVKMGLRLGASGMELDPDLLRSSSWTLYQWVVNSTAGFIVPAAPGMAERLAFADSFGISVDQQLEIEAVLDTLPTPYCRITLDWLDLWFQDQWGGQDAKSMFYYNEHNAEFKFN
jgi:hypothetical protein